MLADDTLLNTISALRFDLVLVGGVPFLPCYHLLPHLLKLPYVRYVTLEKDKLTRKSSQRQVQM